MACIEHNCARCGFWSMDNERLRVCPDCGSNEISNIFDENPDIPAVQGEIEES